MTWIYVQTCSDLFTMQLSELYSFVLEQMAELSPSPLCSLRLQPVQFRMRQDKGCFP